MTADHHDPLSVRWDNFWQASPWNKFKTFKSTQFHGTSLVTPDDSYKFFAEFFDLGKTMTNGRFNTYEIDFLDANFQVSLEGIRCNIFS